MRSGVLTSIAPKVSSQERAMSASKLSRSAARSFWISCAGGLARRLVSDKENDFGYASRRQLELCAHRGARVQRRANLVGQGRGARQRGRVRERPVTAYEFAPIARPIGLGAPHIGKSDARTESQIPGIERENCACRRVNLGLDKSERCGSRCAQHPLDKAVTLR